MFDLYSHMKSLEWIHRKQNRKWDKDVPYWTHPMWCATMILSEKNLSKKDRELGALALLYHDAIECDSESYVPEEVIELVREMTFSGFDQEIIELASKSDFAILLKLYDKAHNLLDGHWMSGERKDEYILHTMRIVEFVKQTYGDLQICRIARTLFERVL